MQLGDPPVSVEIIRRNRWCVPPYGLAYRL